MTKLKQILQALRNADEGYAAALNQAANHDSERHRLTDELTQEQTRLEQAHESAFKKFYDDYAGSESGLLPTCRDAWNAAILYAAGMSEPALHSQTPEVSNPPVRIDWSKVEVRDDGTMRATLTVAEPRQPGETVYDFDANQIRPPSGITAPPCPSAGLFPPMPSYPDIPPIPPAPTKQKPSGIAVGDCYRHIETALDVEIVEYNTNSGRVLIRPYLDHSLKNTPTILGTVELATSELESMYVRLSVVQLSDPKDGGATVTDPDCRSYYFAHWAGGVLYQITGISSGAGITCVNLTSFSEHTHVEGNMTDVEFLANFWRVL